MKLTLPHIKTYTAKGKRYYYHRRTGKRIEGELGTLAFMQSYDAACKLAVEQTETFKMVIADFYSSKLFQKLSDRTRADYLKHRNIIEPKWGKLPLAVLKDERIKRDFRKWRDELCGTIGDRQADLVFATTRRIVSFGKDDGRLPINHLLEIEAVYESDRSDIIWLPEHVEAFMSSANAQMQLAMILALNLGRREADLIRLTWGDFRGEHIMVTNRKSGRDSQFPAETTPTLRETLENQRLALGRIPRKDETILITATGMAWTESHFSTKFSAAKNRAGLTELHFHDLRGTAVTVLAENGSSNSEIASITGHSLKYVHAILDKYMARTRKLNAAATRKLADTWIASVRMK